MSDDDHLPDDPLHDPLEAYRRFLDIQELVDQGLIDDIGDDLLEEGEEEE